jgi:hypothetical protein
MDMKNTQLYSYSQMEGSVLCDVRLGPPRRLRHIPEDLNVRTIAL